MQRFNLGAYKKVSDLPLAELDTVRFSVYVLDKDWNYLFVNRFVTDNLNIREDALSGRNMWEEFPQLAAHPSFQQLRSNCEKGLPIEFVTTSPLNMQRLKVIGKPLKDGYVFFSSILPTKEDVLSDLRNELRLRLDNLHREFSAMRQEQKNLRAQQYRRFYDIYVN